MFFRFAYVEVLYFLLPILGLITLYRLRWYISPRYLYPLTGMLVHHNALKPSYHKKLFMLLRFVGLLGLGLLIARPQMVDERSIVNVDGVDIVLTMDVSNSMQLIDDMHDRRTRFEVAKDEAIRFIEKRTNDPIGIALFAKDTLSYSPLTLDKNFLKQLVGNLEMGMIDGQGTSLGTGLTTAINRLKNSKAKSRIIILLTDGEPTPDDKIDPIYASTLAKKFGIKVYTIGIGSDNGSFVRHPIFGFQQVMVSSFNKDLLEKIAHETGGQAFHARNPKDMRIIYDKIDTLERTSYETNIFRNYFELFLSFMWIILLILGLECFLRLVIWRGILS